MISTLLSGQPFLKGLYKYFFKFSTLLKFQFVAIATIPGGTITLVPCLLRHWLFCFIMTLDDLSVAVKGTSSLSLFTAYISFPGLINTTSHERQSNLLKWADTGGELPDLSQSTPRSEKGALLSSSSATTQLRDMIG